MSLEDQATTREDRASTQVAKMQSCPQCAAPPIRQVIREVRGVMSATYACELHLWDVRWMVGAS